MTKPFRPVSNKIGILKSSKDKSETSKVYGEKREIGPQKLLAAGGPLVYSISIRDGEGIDLGLIPDSSLVSFIISIATDYAISIEMGGVKQHWQILLKTTVSINEIRAKILSIYRSRWNANQVKYASKVSLHNSEEVLLNYVCKQRQVEVSYPLYNPVFTSYSKKQIQWAQSYAGHKETDISFLNFQNDSPPDYFT